MMERYIEAGFIVWLIASALYILDTLISILSRGTND
jgi:hypothetical protein